MLRRLALLTVAAVVLAGCAAPERREPPGGKAPDGEDRDGDNGEAPVVDAHAVDNAFQPQDIQLRQGERLRFSNVGAAEHSITIAREGALLAQEDRDLQPGENAVVDLPDPGAYKLRCRYHSTGFEDPAEMTARITVA